MKKKREKTPKPSRHERQEAYVKDWFGGYSPTRVDQEFLRYFQENLHCARNFEEGAAVECLCNCAGFLRRGRLPPEVLAFLENVLREIIAGKDPSIALLLRRPNSGRMKAAGEHRLFCIGRAVAEFRQEGAPMTQHSAKESAFYLAAKANHVSESTARAGWRVYKRAIAGPKFELGPKPDDAKFGELAGLRDSYDPQKPWAFLPGKYKMVRGLGSPHEVMMFPASSSPERQFDENAPFAIIHFGVKKSP